MTQKLPKFYKLVLGTWNAHRSSEQHPKSSLNFARTFLSENFFRGIFSRARGKTVPRQPACIAKKLSSIKNAIKY